ncbi:transcriptional activator of glycolytic enzymes-domain-containing protein [Poronia punctata]|nr:transcriptional activator of glycolytic enzymes-domain-containing protein [Poronia punctata]
MPPIPSLGQVTDSIASPSTSALIHITTTNSNTTASTSTPTPTTTPTPASTPTPTPAPATITTPAPRSAAVTRGAVKRPATSDLQRIAGTSATPSSKKRQATASGSYNPPPPPAMMPVPALVTEEQLHGQTPEQLIATILQLQSQQQQFFAQINAQYEHINQQLQDLRGSLIASHQAAASALGSREQPIRSVVPPQPGPPQQTAIPPPPRPTAQTPVQVQTPVRPTPRVPPASPGHHVVSRTSMPASTPTTAGPPQYDYRTVATVEEVWREYREGIDGQPAIEKLDATWGSRWRPEPRGRTWYSRRKVIWDKIKEFINEGLDENSAVQEVEKLREGGTINKLIRMLQDERKDKGMGDDAIMT